MYVAVKSWTTIALQRGQKAQEGNRKSNRRLVVLFSIRLDWAMERVQGTWLSGYVWLLTRYTRQKRIRIDISLLIDYTQSHFSQQPNRQDPHAAGLSM